MNTIKKNGLLMARGPGVFDAFHLFFCLRKGSVVIHFTVAFYVVKSDQMVRLTENMSSKGLLASLELVNITTNRGNVWR